MKTKMKVLRVEVRNESLAIELARRIELDDVPAVGIPPDGQIVRIKHFPIVRHALAHQHDLGINQCEGIGDPLDLVLRLDDKGIPRDLYVLTDVFDDPVLDQYGAVLDIGPRDGDDLGRAPRFSPRLHRTRISHTSLHLQFLDTQFVTTIWRQQVIPAARAAVKTRTYRNQLLGMF